MRTFDITAPDKTILSKISRHIDNLTKPKGSLGMLEELALQISLVQQTLAPELRNPHNILFAADHGILDEGVSVSPREVTWQQLAHFSRGGAGINFLCEQNGFKLVLVDAGVDFDIPEGHGIIDRKIARGTANFLKGPAMTLDQWDECIERGAQTVDEVHRTGCNIVSFGEMGSGNTSPSSVWMHLLTGIPMEKCIGAGAGLDNSGVRHKIDVLKRAVEAYSGGSSDRERLAWFGGFELAMAVGGMLRAAELGMLIIVDGFIMTNCILAASRFNPDILHYAIFGHQGDEAGHRYLLEHLGARPLLHLSMRLGEGSGAVCSYPIIQSAVNMIRNMDTFDDVDVTKYFD